MFDSFRKQKDILGDYFSSFAGDAIIIGSDEVFSVETGLADAFWGNNAKCYKVFSYAASFGPTTMDEIQEKKLEDYMSKALRNFSSIAVRDKNSKEIIKELVQVSAELIIRVSNQ